MSRAEWAEQVALLRAEWPHAAIPDESIAAWWEHVADLGAAEARAAVASLARQGREFPPSGGTIRRRCEELRRTELGHGAAYALAMRAATAHGGCAEGLLWLRERDALTALAAERYGWREFCLEPAADTTRRAQFRDVYRGAVDEGRERRHREALPGSREPRRLGAALGGLAEGSAS